jgi:hypothetical protein
VKYELGFYIPEGGILHSHCHENLKSYKLIFVEDIRCLLESTNHQTEMDNSTFWDMTEYIPLKA